MNSCNFLPSLRQMAGRSDGTTLGERISPTHFSSSLSSFVLAPAIMTLRREGELRWDEARLPTWQTPKDGPEQCRDLPCGSDSLAGLEERWMWVFIMHLIYWMLQIHLDYGKGQAEWALFKKPVAWKRSEEPYDYKSADSIIFSWAIVNVPSQTQGICMLMTNLIIIRKINTYMIFFVVLVTVVKDKEKQKHKQTEKPTNWTKIVSSKRWQFFPPESGPYKSGGPYSWS